MRVRKRNWLGETTKAELERRIRALEYNVRDMNLALSAMYGKVFEGETTQEALERIVGKEEKNAGRNNQDKDI